MARLKQIESFVAVAIKGSLTAAANAEGVAPAVIGRRIDAIEERLGVKLLLRTTRRITLTHEGSAFLEDCQRLLADLANAEASVSAGGVKASGYLRITAPAGFGRRHVAPLVPRFMAEHPEVKLSLNLSDRVVDIVNEGYDCAVRVGDLPDSSLVSVRLADNWRLCVAAPAYLKRAGTPRQPSELQRHECLTLSSDASQTRGWAFAVEGQVIHMRPSGRLDCTDGQVLHDWCLAGLGLAWRSTWEVEKEIASGALVSVLDEFAAPPNGVFAIFPQRKHLPLRVRLWIDYLKLIYGEAGYWGTGGGTGGGTGAAPGGGSAGGGVGDAAGNGETGAAASTAGSTGGRRSSAVGTADVKTGAAAPVDH
jgi:DNA-binding transcriptional LysR family regulator